MHVILNNPTRHFEGTRSPVVPFQIFKLFYFPSLLMGCLYIRHIHPLAETTNMKVKEG